MGPAFVAAVAYIDPGNFATNITAGARFGYLLVWVVIVSNLMAMLIQYLSAKAGIATGRNLPELCRDNFRPAVTRGLWVQAELVAVATDLAEVLGGAIALRLLFGLPLLVGGLITAVVAFALLGVQSRGARPFELAITGMLMVVLAGFLYSLVLGGIDTGAAASGLVPRFDGADSVMVAAGMLGATVMPHVIYLHGALTQNRYARGTERERLALLHSQRLDVVVAMSIAGLINLSMLVVAAQVLSGISPPVETIEAARDGLGVALGHPAAVLFALALLASGFAASGVGTLAGQVVMQGFLQRRIPLVLRRLVTLAPALVVIAAGVDPTRALVISQVVLSFGIPFVLIPLVLLTRRRDVMGALVNRRSTTAVAAIVAGVITLLNVTLIALTVMS
ncbi:Nramp family divalent metal transporter [Microlunatus ginsengisoli]|uniref:Nramp family divalent metal transporter n=1 Tax=Microlunatus ginsengisoli TaxID=363863 RepID=UPI0031E30EB4